MLSCNKVAIVDDDDFDELNSWKWYYHAAGHGYAYRFEDIAGWRYAVFMHRYILAAPHGTDVDHIDGNGLNNRKANLRLATRSQNCFYRHPSKRNKTGASGVLFRARKRTKQFEAQIKARGVYRFIGSFDTFEEAKQARDRVAIELFGEFALL